MRKQSFPEADRVGERIAKQHAKLSPALGKVAEYINTHRQAVMEMTAAELGIAVGTSDATVIRAVQALGFASIRELKQELASATGFGSTPADNMVRTLAALPDHNMAVRHVLTTHSELMAGISDAECRQMQAAISILAGALRIGFYGIGPSAALAQYAHFNFVRAGCRGILLDACGIALADQLLDLDGVAALLMFAYGAAYPEAEATIAEARRLAIPIVLFSDSLDDRLAREAEVLIPIPRGRAGSMALHGATLVCVEAILLGVIAKNTTRAMVTLRKLDELRWTLRGRRKGVHAKL